MACTVRCRRSGAPKETCRCSCGGANHGGEANAGTTGARGADGTGNGAGGGTPGETAHGAGRDAGREEGKARLAEALREGARIQKRVAEAGAPHERAVAVYSARARGLLVAAISENDVERQQRLDSAFDTAYERMIRARDARARARIEEVLGALNDERGMGGVPQTFTADSSPQQTAIAGSRGVLACFPADWLAASRDKGEMRLEAGLDQYDSYYYPAHTEEDGKGRIRLGPPALDDPPERLALHEMCHRMEDSVPEIVELEREYHRRRVAVAWDGEGRPRPGMHEEGPEPRAKPPFFWNYVERRYPANRPDREAYELFAVGYEHLMFGPSTRFLHSESPEWFTGEDTSSDPEYESFVLGLLATAGKPSSAEERGAGGRG